jgi:hypothetical protein
MSLQRNESGTQVGQLLLKDGIRWKLKKRGEKNKEYKIMLSLLYIRGLRSSGMLRSASGNLLPTSWGSVPFCLQGLKQVHLHT